MAQPRAKFTDRVLKFIAAFAANGNATQSAKDAGYSEKTAYSQGNRLLKNADIQAEIAKRRERIAAKLEITREKVLNDLEAARIAAMAAGQFTSAIRASELQGKDCGMFVESVNHNVSGHLQTIDTRLGEVPEDKRLALLAALDTSLTRSAHPAKPEHLPGCNGKCVPGCPTSDR